MINKVRVGYEGIFVEIEAVDESTEVILNRCVNGVLFLIDKKQNEKKAAQAQSDPQAIVVPISQSEIRGYT